MSAVDILFDLTTLGASRPLRYWTADWERLAPALAEALGPIVATLEDGTAAKKNANALLATLSEKQPDEYLLSAEIQRISDVLRPLAIGPQKQRIASFLSASNAFFQRAKLASFHAKDRIMIKKRLDESAQTAFDRRLFEREGMTYILEYYLAVYKAIQDAPTLAERRKFLECASINLGYGGAPGILLDVERNEALEKFVEKIIDDSIRSDLDRAFYEFRPVCQRAHLVCANANDCRADFADTSVEQIVSAFKAFLESLIAAFGRVGIERLSSVFFKPYGENPRLTDIHL